MRELYVGNLPANIMEFQLKEFLGTCIMQAELNTMPGSSIINVRVSGEYRKPVPLQPLHSSRFVLRWPYATASLCLQASSPSPSSVQSKSVTAQ
jgi:hypothetical protein